MTARFGITLPALLGIPISTTSIPTGGLFDFPPSIANLLARLSVLSYDGAVSDERILYSGMIQTSILQDWSDQAADWPVRVPGLFETGLPFRFFEDRGAIAPGDQIEQSGSDWVLQISTGGISIALPFSSATFVEESAVRPAYLAEGDGSNARLEVDAGVLEITSGGNVVVRPNLSLSPDPYSGALVRFRFDPKQFFVASDVVGIRAGEVILDLSELISPSAAERAGFGPSFQGVYLEELGVYFPPETPFIIPKSITLRDALIGTGFAGEGIIELSDQPQDPPVPTFVNANGETIEIGDDNKVLLPLDRVDGVPQPRMRVVAVADIGEPWADRIDQARWTLPNSERFEGHRTEVLMVEPGDLIEYYYEPPSSSPTFEAPAPQTFEFAADPVEGDARTGLKGRIQLEVEDQTFFDVTHINAPLPMFEFFRLKAVDETGLALTDEIEFSWQVRLPDQAHSETVRPDDDDRTILNLGYISNEPEAAADAETPDQLNAKATTIVVNLYAAGAKRSVIIDIIGDKRLAGFAPIVVAKSAVESAGWTVYELISSGGPPAVPEVAVLPKNRYNIASALIHGKLLQTTGERTYNLNDDRTTEPEPELDEVTPEPISADLICRGLSPGYVYELLPTQTGVNVNVPARQVKQISFFFKTALDQRDHINGVSDDFNRQQQTPRSVGEPLNINGLLTEALAGLERGHIIVVGRSSTRSDIENSGRRRQVNERYAVGRANTVASIVRDALTPEQAGTVSVVVREETDLPPVSLAAHDEDLQNDRERFGDTLAHTNRTPEHDNYQRADVLITHLASESGPVWTPRTESRSVNQIRRALLPCPNAVRGEPIKFTINDGALKRLRAAVRWDRDPTPTKMELLAVWRTSEVEVSAGSTLPAEVGPAIADVEVEEDLWRLVIGLLQDARTGRSRWSLTLDAAEDADGLFTWPLPTGLGTALVFGPLFARMAQAEADDGGETNTAGWVTLGALTAASAVAEALGVISQVKVIANAISLDIDTRNGPFDQLEAFYLKLDYSVEFRVSETELLGLQTHEDHPVRLRFRNVGFCVNTVTNEVRFLFDETATGDFSVEDAGSFVQTPDSGVLGGLVQVVGARLGQGSVFVELDLQFALDIGLLEITQTKLRLIFDDDEFRVQLQGIGVKVDIPKTLEGEGSLVVRDNGFRATLALNIIPVELYAAGSIEFTNQGEYSSVAVGLLAEFPVGLPLGGSGLGIFGLLGQFAANMTRNVSSGGDRIQAEMDWLGLLLSPGASGVPGPWTPQREFWAFGVGAVVGTLPDGGKSFHAKGALVLEIPGPTVLFGIDAKFISERRKTEGAVEEGGGGFDASIRGLIGITPDAFIIGIRVDIEFGELLTIKVPISALFPTVLDDANRPSGFLRIGSDGVNPGGTRADRSGDAVSVELKLSDFLDLEAYCYLMIEEHDLYKLGHRDNLNFDGFSIGFGLGISLFLGSRTFGTYIEAELLVLAGMGTSPIVIGGFMEASGKLSILWISFTVSANLEFLHRQPGPQLPPGQRSGIEPISEPSTTFKGNFCAEISFFFFSIKACFGFEFGSDDPCLAPPPPPLLSGLGFVDRRGFEIDKVGLTEEGEQEGTAIVWPDSIITVNLLAEPDLELAAESPFVGTLTSTDHSTLRVGDFIYKFVLNDLQLERRVGTTWVSAGDRIESAMWFPTGRSAFIEEDETTATDSTGSGAEVRSIGIGSWDPIPWARALVPGAHPGVEDNIASAADDICEKHDGRLSDCAFFQSAQPTGESGEFTVRGQARRADLFARTVEESGESLGKLIISVLDSGDFEFCLASRIEFPVAVTTPAGAITAGLRVAQFRELRRDRLATVSTLETVLSLVRPQYQGVLTILVNDSDLETGGDTARADLLVPDRHELTLERGRTVIARSFSEGDVKVEAERIGSAVLSSRGSADKYSILRFSTADSELGDTEFNEWHLPPTLADVIILEACGLDHGARVEAERRNQIREAAAERLRNLAAGGGSVDPGDPGDPPTDPPGDRIDSSQFVLEADSQYRVTADWTWTGTRFVDPVGSADSERIDCSSKPPTGGVVNQTFEFMTAAEIGPVVVPDTPVPPTAETADIDFETFDVRDLSMYVKEAPEFNDPPMFTDSLIFVQYHVNHIDKLLQRYDRSIDLAVVRTDGPTEHSSSPDRTPVEGAPTWWERVLFDALREQACIGGNLPANAAGEALDVVLEPNARYDLVMTGPKSGAAEPLDQHLIYRAPFQTSRYPGPAELFTALGFGSGANPVYYRPQDLILAEDLSPSIPAVLASDVDFESGLDSIGVVHTQPDEPLTTVFWRPPIEVPVSRLTVRDALTSLRVLQSGRVDIVRLAQLVVDALPPTLTIPGVPTIPDILGPPIFDAIPINDDIFGEIPTISSIDDAMDLRSTEFTLELFNELLAAEGLDEDGRVVPKLASRLANDFRRPERGGLKRAVEVLGDLIRGAMRPATREQNWRIAGVLIESQEPILRDGLVDIESLEVAGSSLSLIRSNSSQSRLLYLAAASIEMNWMTSPDIMLTFNHHRPVVEDGQLNAVVEPTDAVHAIGRRPQSIDWEV